MVVEVATSSNAEIQTATSSNVDAKTDLRANTNMEVATSSDAEWEETEVELFNDLVPQISVTVPIETVILVGADGSCAISESEIQNQGSAEVYLTEVAYSWRTRGEVLPETLFTAWQEQRPYAELTLADGTSHTFSSEDTDSLIWNQIQGENRIAAGEALTLNWDFSLNENCLTDVLPDRGEAVIATVTYTVSDQPF